MSKTIKWCRSLFCRKNKSSADPEFSRQDITLNRLSVENACEQVPTTTADCLADAGEETGKGSLSTFKIELGDGKDSPYHGPPVCLTEMLANDELFQVLEGRKFLMCAEILVDGVTDKQSLQLHGQIPVTVKRTVRDDGKRVKELRLSGKLKKRNYSKKQEVVAATQTVPQLPRPQDSENKFRAVSNHLGLSESNDLNVDSSHDNKDLGRTINLSTGLNRRIKNAEESGTDPSEKLTDIDLIKRSDDVNILVKNDHKTRIDYGTSVTTIQSITREKRSSKRPKVKKSRSCAKIKGPVATITVTRSHTRFIKYDDGFEVEEKLGTECVTMSAPRGLYFVDSRPTLGDATDYDDCNMSTSVEERTETREVKYFPRNEKLVSNDATIFNVKADSGNNPLFDGLQWLAKNVIMPENENTAIDSLSQS